MSLSTKEQTIYNLGVKHNWDKSLIAQEMGVEVADISYQIFLVKTKGGKVTNDPIWKTKAPVKIVMDDGEKLEVTAHEHISEETKSESIEPEEDDGNSGGEKSCVDFDSQSGKDEVGIIAPEVEIEEKQEEVIVEKAKDVIFNLATFVPSKSTRYITRDIDSDVKFWSDTKNDRGYRESVALIGEAGSGKNQMVLELAHNLNLPCLIIPCDDSQVLNQMLGYWQAKSGTTIWNAGLLTKFVSIPSVVVFDEVNCLPGSRLFMLHELLENRKLFSKDAPADQAMTEVHTDCRIFLAMNPPTAGYSGTNRLNIALGSRPAFCEIPDFTPEQMNINTGNADWDGKLAKFYADVKRTVKDQGMRVSISIRNMNRISNALKHGASIKTAVVQGFINSALATASSVERNTLMDIARSIFGASEIDGKIAAQDVKW